ncbi:MAG TPA: cation:proton antiporter, partial [Nitrolancea sp.]|nr:cation:proton antiporter [Nitrolancea sp.]
MPDLETALALLAVVLLVAALFSGLVARLPLSFPMIFLGLGFLLGERGLGVIHIGVDDPALEAIAIVSLSFVLFLDAINLRFDELGPGWRVPLLALGPGTLLTVALVALGAALALGLSPLNALLLGAILASVDPVVLRDVARDRRIPRSIRLALTTEAGTNDVIVLPLVLVLSAIEIGGVSGVTAWLALLARLFLLGPLVGAALGFALVWLIAKARAHELISREYRALYGVGGVLAAYVAGEAVGGSGFLAVFAAGVVVAATDYDLCDCFLEFDEVTAEMAMLLAFILFGALLSTLLGSVPPARTLLFALLVLAVARPLALGVVLARAVVSRPARLFMGWFGPRGLSSLLFGLLVVRRGVPDGERLLALSGAVVVVSVVLHGVSEVPLAGWYGRAVERQTLPEEREG